MPVTVYIPCHNAEKFICRCLESVFDQTLRPAEVIIVNDGSTDRTVEIAKRFPIRIIDLPSHPGLAAARNAAIKAANHGYIATIDADCVAEPAWLECLMDALDDKSAAGAGGRLEERYCNSLADRWRAVHMRQNWGDKKIVNPPFLFGCNTLFRKSALEEVGLYNIRFRSNGEDVDISHRLLARGYNLVYEPATVLEHLKKDTYISVLKADWNWGYKATGETLKYETYSNIVYFNYINAKYRFSQDLSAKRHSLLPLDLLLFFYHTYLDIEHRKTLGIRKPPAGFIASRVRTFTEFKIHLDRLSRERFLKNPDEWNKIQN